MNGARTGISLKVQVAIAITLTAGFLYFLPALDRWIKARFAAPVQTLALQSKCREPEEGEHRMFIVVEEAGKARVLDCVYFVSRGHRRRALQAIK